MPLLPKTPYRLILTPAYSILPSSFPVLLHPLFISRDMQITKDNIRKELLQTAGRIFMQKGFLKTSMREIAEVSCVGLSNIYNYFKSKDEIFCEIVKPVTQAFEITLQKHHGSGRQDMNNMWSPDYLRQTTEEYLRIINRHGRLMELLLFRSQGSSLEKFKEQFTGRSTALVKEHAQRMRNEHPGLKLHVSDFTIHLHTVWMFSLLEECILYHPAPDEQERIVTEYVAFELAGWKELKSM